MVCILGSILLFMISFIFIVINDLYNIKWIPLSLFIVTFLISFFAILVSGMFFVCCYINTITLEQQIKATQQTINVSRSQENTYIENAAMIHKIIEINQELETVQYWASNKFTSWYFPRSILKIKPIK